MCRTSCCSLLFAVSVVALRVELSTTRLSAASGQPALDYQYFQVGKVGLEPTVSALPRVAIRLRTARRRPLLPKTRGLAAAPHPASQSERQDLNLRSPGTRPGAMTRLRYVLIKYPVGESNPFPTGIRNPSAVSAGRGMSCAHCERKVGLTVLEPVSPGLQPGVMPSQLPVHLVVWARKKPDVAVTPGFWLFSRGSGQVSQAQRMPGQRIRRIIGNPPLASRFGFET